jgi:hypothetical protein
MQNAEPSDLNRFAMDLNEIAKRHSPQAERLLTDMLRDLEGGYRVWMSFLMDDLWRKSSFEAIAKAYQFATENERRIKFVELAYGKELADDFGEWLRLREAPAV